MTVWLVECREGRGLKEVPQTVLLPRSGTQLGWGPAGPGAKRADAVGGSGSVEEA